MSAHVNGHSWIFVLLRPAIDDYSIKRILVNCSFMYMLLRFYCLFAFIVQLQILSEHELKMMSERVCS